MSAQPRQPTADYRFRLQTVRSVHLDSMPLTSYVDPTSHPDEVPDAAVDEAAFAGLPEPLRSAAVRLGNGAGQTCTAADCVRPVGWTGGDADGGDLIWLPTVLVEAPDGVRVVCGSCVPEALTPRSRELAHPNPRQDSLTSERLVHVPS